MNYNKKMARDYSALNENYKWLRTKYNEMLSSINILVQTTLHIVDTDEKNKEYKRGLITGLLSKLEKEGFRYGYW